ncbi:MAG: hypothetical protein C4297_06250 [Gemmataceae bacterium]
MAHIEMSKPRDEFLPVFYNVDGVVGAPPADNKREDVLLVQFFIVLIGRSPTPDIPPNVAAAFKAVQLTGVADAQTIAAIKAFQESNRQKRPNVVVDGRASPAKPGVAYAPGAAWTIVHLNLESKILHPDVWPRIDKIQGCPDDLKKMVERETVGKTL